VITNLILSGEEILRWVGHQHPAGGGVGESPYLQAALMVLNYIKNIKLMLII
jgi:hypothetical protein